MRLTFALVPAVLMAAAIVCGGCGRKAPPRWVEPSQPLPPQNLRAIARPDSITLYWLPSPKIEGVTVKGYAVYRAGEAGKFEEIGFVNSAAYLDTKVMPGVRYAYRVLARSLGDGSESRPAELSASAAVGLEPPLSLDILIEDSGIVLKWDVNPNASGYMLYKGYAPDVQSASPASPSIMASGEFRDRAEPASTVYYHVRAVLEGDEVVSEGDTSSVVELSPGMFVPSAPKGINAVRSEQKVLVFWDENPEAWVGGYRVFRAAGDGGVFEPIGDARTLALPDNNPPIGKLRYRVSALAAGREGPPSAEAVVMVGEQGR